MSSATAAQPLTSDRYDAGAMSTVGAGVHVPPVDSVVIVQYVGPMSGTSPVFSPLGMKLHGSPAPVSGLITCVYTVAVAHAASPPQPLSKAVAQLAPSAAIQSHAHVG